MADWLFGAPAQSIVIGWFVIAGLCVFYALLLDLLFFRKRGWNRAANITRQPCSSKKTATVPGAPCAASSWWAGGTATVP